MYVYGYFNKQNCRIWYSEKLHVVLPEPMRSLRKAVWWGLWSGDIIAPYFFENEYGEITTVSGDTYRTKVTYICTRSLCYCCKRCLVSTGQPYISCHNRFIASNVWWSFSTLTVNYEITRTLHSLLRCQLRVISYSFVGNFSPKKHHFCFLMIAIV